MFSPFERIKKKNVLSFFFDKNEKKISKPQIKNQNLGRRQGDDLIFLKGWRVGKVTTGDSYTDKIQIIKGTAPEDARSGVRSPKQRLPRHYLNRGSR